MVKRRLIKEAQGIFALSDSQEVMTYIKRLYEDLDKNTLNFNEVFLLDAEVKNIETKLRLAKQQWREKVQSLLEIALKRFGEGKVEIALFGEIGIDNE